MMRVLGIIFFISLFTASVKADTATQIILQKRAAVTVSPVRFYADSSFTKSTETTFTEGELFEIISETLKEHFDNTQTQTFKWYKVRSLNGQTGWIFGDNLAVVMPELLIDNRLKPFYKKEAHFDNGFEKSLIWVASSEGHDVKKSNPAYKELYLIITNDGGKSVNLNFSNINDLSKKYLQSIYFQDVTNNKIDEIIIETSNTTSDKEIEERNIEIYTFKAGSLSKIFEERLTLTWEEDVPSPAFSKFIEIEGSEIRIAYVDYVPCEKYSLRMPTDVRSQTMERCLEYVTYSFVWDNAKRNFQPFYRESRAPLNGLIKKTLTLRKAPSVNSDKIATLATDDKVLIIKHFDALKSEKGVKKIDNWLYVKHPSGIYGYVHADDIVFKNIEHAAVLKEYYNKTPLLKQDWTSAAVFLSVKK